VIALETMRNTEEVASWPVKQIKDALGIPFMQTCSASPEIA
jgi:hypothetical protein